MDVVFVDEASVKTAITQVRKDTSDVNWAAVTYENPKSQKLKLLGSGNGGIPELVRNLTPELCVYALVRTTDQIDESVTVKFAFIVFQGEEMPRMQRARISVHQSGVHQFFGQSHVDYSCTSTADLSTEIILTKIMEVSGTASRVLGSSGSKEGADRVRVSSSAPAIAKMGKGKATEDAVVLSDEAKAGIAAVRADSDPTTWTLAQYDGQQLKLVQSGTGAVDAELLPLLTADMIGYALVRKTETIDESETVKFSFITWLGGNVPRMLRARLSAHSATIDTFYKPYHVVLHCEKPEEVSDEIIVAAIAKTSGRASHVIAEAKPVEQRTWQKRTGGAAAPAPAAAAPAPAPVPAPAAAKPRLTKAAAAPAASGAAPQKDKDAMPFEDEEGCRAVVKDVRRDDGAGKTWMFIGVKKGSNSASLIGSGSGDSIEDAKALFQDDLVAWGLVRRTLRVDESDTTKFAFVTFTGENIPRMLRARLGTWSGKIKEFFTPYHCDIAATTLAELTDAAIQTAIETAAGRKSNVLS
jgi:hypothetical protein